MFPEYYRLTVKTGYAFVIDQQNSILTTNWYTDQKFNNNNFFHEYTTGNMVLKDGNLSLEGNNKDITVKNGNLSLEGNNKNLIINGNGSGINVSGGHIISLSGNMVLKDGNLSLEGNNKNLIINGNGSGINVLHNSGYIVTQNLSSVNTFLSGCTLYRKNVLNNSSTISINCSIANYFEITSIIYNQNFIFSNVPQNLYTLYKCTLKCEGNLRTNNFPGNVRWSRRSFQYEYPSSSDYVAIFNNINGDGNSDTYIITFTTWDNGVTWYADAEKYEN